LILQDEYSRIALSAFLGFLFLLVAFAPFANRSFADSCISGIGPNDQTSYQICVPDGEVISPYGSISITVSVTALTSAAAAYTFTLGALVGSLGFQIVYYGCPTAGDCSHTFNFPSDFSDYSAPLAAGGWGAQGSVLGVATNSGGSFTVSDNAFSTPQFPLGTILAVVAPLAALSLYALLRSRISSASRLP
jgi:hypothetical protein